MRRHLGLPILILTATLVGCQGPRPVTKSPTPPADLQAQQAKNQAAAKLCRQTGQNVTAALAALRQAERQLNRLKQQGEPAAGNPPVWDEAREERFSEQDQDLDRQRYGRQLALWQQQQAERSQAWEGRHSLELAAAQSQLNRRARALRRQHPDLFTGASSIEVNPAVLAQLLRCPDTG